MLMNSDLAYILEIVPNEKTFWDEVWIAIATQIHEIQGGQYFASKVTTSRKMSKIL